MALSFVEGPIEIVEAFLSHLFTSVEPSDADTLLSAECVSLAAEGPL